MIYQLKFKQIAFGIAEVVSGFLLEPGTLEIISQNMNNLKKGEAADTPGDFLLQCGRHGIQVFDLLGDQIDKLPRNILTQYLNLLGAAQDEYVIGRVFEIKEVYRSLGAKLEDFEKTGLKKIEVDQTLRCISFDLADSVSPQRVIEVLPELISYAEDKYPGFYVEINLRQCVITDEIIDKISGFKNKISLILRNTNLTNCQFKRLVENCAGLYAIDVSGCQNISGEGIDWSKAVNLGGASLIDCALTNRALKAMVENVPRLGNLNVSGCPDISGEGISWDRACSLTWVSFGETAFSDQALKDLVENLPNLFWLHLHSCQNITGEGIDWSRAHKLGVVNFSRTGLTAAALRGLVENVPTLTSLSVYGCKELTRGRIEIDWTKAVSLTTVNSRDIKREGRPAKSWEKEILKIIC